MSRIHQFWRKKIGKKKQVPHVRKIKSILSRADPALPFSASTVSMFHANGKTEKKKLQEGHSGHFLLPAKKKTAQLLFAKKKRNKFYIINIEARVSRRVNQQHEYTQKPIGGHLLL